MIDIKRPAICVPITSLVRFGIEQEVRAIAESPADMAEWRVDYFAGSSEDIPVIIRNLKSDLRDKKLIVTLRTTEEGGEENGDRFRYFSVIHQIIEQDMADYADIEISRDEQELRDCVKLAEGKDIRIIGSFHDFEHMPESDRIYELLSRMRELGCDMGKLACMAKDATDTERILEATGRFADANPDYPVVTLAMGKTGYVTRLYGGLYGSRISFAAIGKTSAPGQRNIREMKEVFDKIYSDPKHIFLIGFMGTGKSTVAREMSEVYDLPEVDTDTMIEEKCDRKVADIFAEDGEALFRMIETDVLDELGTWERAVVSCGGGVALKDINVRKLKAMGTIVWLKASAETVFKRVRGSDSRPLLNGHMSVDYIEELMQKRLPAYEAAADVSVITDGRDVGDIAQEIWQKTKTK